MKQAMFWEVKNEDKGIVQCHLCPRHCILRKDELGFCKTRKNIDGTLYTLAHDGHMVNDISIDPIVKKPLYHFLPGSMALSFWTAGCNMRWFLLSRHFAPEGKHRHRWT
ncbi:MAG: hypothetical protein ACP5FL_07415 [Thermoplasmatota archaeon]